MIRKWGPAVVWMAVIFFLSAQSQLPSPQSRLLDFIIEKSAHFVEYGILAALLVRALMPDCARPWHALAITLLIASLYALSDEFHQSFVPGRAADWSDVVSDWLGASVGGILALHAYSLWRKVPAGKEG